ncbi:phage tail protein [Brevundimonas sp.]|uniref:phage tail protein n=2 Tax=Brevundimonas sp. TaxID=1871086 RepID=UPI0028ADDF7F|nr:phage tail protein [Brevundimonas sp.]
MALMNLGMFVFDLPTLTYNQLQRRSTWRHATSDRVGARPAGQFVGPGDDGITLTGMLAPIAFGDPGSLDELRRMADTGEAWPMLDGAGRNYGAFVITALDESQKSILDNGVPRISDFSVTLQRMDDPVLDADPTA